MKLNPITHIGLFPFGVIVIEILTRKFLNSTDRFQNVDVPQLSDKDMRELVSETKQHQAHLQLIRGTQEGNTIFLGSSAQ